MAGFARPVQYVISAYQVELLSIKEALLLIPSLPSHRINVVSDCLLAVLAIQDTHLDQSVVSHILFDIKELLNHLPQVTVFFLT